MEPDKLEKPPAALSVEDRRLSGSAKEFAAVFPRYMQTAGVCGRSEPKKFMAILIDVTIPHIIQFDFSGIRVHQGLAGLRR